MDVSVHVELGEVTVHAGTLFAHRGRGTESATFSYDGEYVGRPGAYALDPELPLASSPRQTRLGAALFGAFGDCSPDRWGRTLMKRRESALARQQARPRAASARSITCWACVTTFVRVR